MQLTNIKCPLCNEAYLIKEYSSSQDEPYFNHIPDKIYCPKCTSHFSRVVVAEGKVKEFELDYLERIK